MISWLQTTFQKHLKWVLVVLLVIITISFVFTLGIGTTHTARNVAERRAFGVDWNDQRQVTREFQDGSLSFFLSYRQQPTSNAQLEAHVFERAAMRYLADELGIPPASADQVRERIQNSPAFAGEDGNFDPAAYQTALDQFTARNEEAALARTLEDDVRAVAVARLLAGPGYVTPYEVRRMAALDGTQYAIETATLAFETFQPEIAVTDAALEAFFQERAARYAIPERRVVTAVRFTAEEFLAAIPAPAEADVTRYFEANKARFRTVGADGSSTEPELAAVRDQVEAALRRDLAARRAGDAATDFVYGLYLASTEGGLKANTPEVDAYIVSRNRVGRRVGPFTAAGGAGAEALTPTMAQAAFRLDDQRFFSDPIQDGDAFEVLVWGENVPESVPALAEVRARVEEDFRAAERRRLFVERGAQVRTELLAKVQGGATFQAAATELGLAFAQASGFSRQSAPPEGVPGAALNAIGSLREPGAVSDMIALPDNGGGVFVRLVSAEPPSADALNMMMAMNEFRQRRFAMEGMRRSLLSEWTRQEQIAAGLIEPEAAGAQP